LLALVASLAVRLPLSVEVALAVVAELLALLAVRGAVVDRRRPRPAEWAALAAVAPAVCVLRVGWVLRSNAAHRQWFW
jgi:hypothetical protein